MRIDIEEVRESGVGRRYRNPASDRGRADEDHPLPITKQLTEGGRLTVPLGITASFQALSFATKRKDELEVEHLSPAAFVPMVGEMRK